MEQWRKDLVATVFAKSLKSEAQIFEVRVADAPRCTSKIPHRLAISRQVNCPQQIVHIEFTYWILEANRLLLLLSFILFYFPVHSSFFFLCFALSFSCSLNNSYILLFNFFKQKIYNLNKYSVTRKLSFDKEKKVYLFFIFHNSTILEFCYKM